MSQSQQIKRRSSQMHIIGALGFRNWLDSADRNIAFLRDSITRFVDEECTRNQSRPRRQTNMTSYNVGNRYGGFVIPRSAHRATATVNAISTSGLHNSHFHPGNYPLVIYPLPIKAHRIMTGLRSTPSSDDKPKAEPSASDGKKKCPVEGCVEIVRSGDLVCVGHMRLISDETKHALERAWKASQRSPDHRLIYDNVCKRAVDEAYSEHRRLQAISVGTSHNKS